MRGWLSAAALAATFLFSSQALAYWPPGLMSIARMESNELHAKYSYCMGVFDIFARVAHKVNKLELERKAKNHLVYTRRLADQLRLDMVTLNLFHSTVDMITFDIAANAVYADGQEYVLYHDMDDGIVKLKFCVELVQPKAKEPKDEQDRNTRSN